MEDYSEIKSDGEYIIIPNPIYDERNEYLKLLIKRDNTISALEMKLEERQQVIIEKEKVIEENEKAMKEKEQEIESNRKLIIELAKTLKDNNVSIDVIHQKTNLSKELIEIL